MCVQCNSRAYFQFGVCQPVSDQCQTFDQNTGACTSCFKGFDLLLNGICVKGDNQCMIRNVMTGLCSTCYLGYNLTADGVCKWYACKIITAKLTIKISNIKVLFSQ